LKQHRLDVGPVGIPVTGNHTDGDGTDSDKA
jgi:hypothetical protein